VLHLAGAITYEPLLETTGPSLAAALRPKLAGAWQLHTALADTPLDFFALFSSGSALLPSPRLGSYAAANAAQDALVHYRRRLGLPAQTINWGFWSEAGMIARHARATGEDLTPTAMGRITLEAGLATLEQILQRPEPQIAVLPIDWPRWQRTYPTASQAPLLRTLLEKEQPPAEAAPTEGVAATILGSPSPQRAALLEAHLRETVALVLRLSDAAAVDPRTPLRSLGLDSLMSMELRARLERSLERQLPSTLVWNYPTVRAMADFLLTLLAPPPAPAAPVAPTDIADLSDEEAMALLERELDALAALKKGHV
jgi:acyl carrier protein